MVDQVTHPIVRTTLPIERIERLARIAGMIGSAHDGEIATSARKLRDALAVNGLTLADIIRAYGDGERRGGPGVHVYRDPSMFRQKEPRHRAYVDACLAALPLNDWEREFLVGIRAAPSLSVKQQATLDRLYGRVLQERAA